MGASILYRLGGVAASGLGFWWFGTRFEALGHGY
jgi:hypothetical protein